MPGTDVSGSGIGVSLGKIGGYPSNLTITANNVQQIIAALRQQLAIAAAAAAAALRAQPNTQSPEWSKATLLGDRIEKQIAQLQSITLPVTTDSQGYLQGHLDTAAFVTSSGNGVAGAGSNTTSGSSINGATAPISNTVLLIAAAAVVILLVLDN